MVDFVEVADALIVKIGEGPIVGNVAFNQVYAHRQHVELGWKHPHGGQAYYLSTPLYANAERFIQRLADNVLEGSLDLAMIANVTELADQAAALAPVQPLLRVLRGSAHPWVTKEERVIFDRPPIYPRMPDIVLDEMHKFVYDATHPGRRPKRTIWNNAFRAPKGG
jgi:hypothetical protein